MKLDQTRIYINLSAGLAHPLAKSNGVIFCHLQSSHIETNAWDKFFCTLPDDLLLHLALGYRCVIIDCSSNNGGKSKVIRIGIPVIRFILRKRWFNEIKFEPFLDRGWLLKIANDLDKSTKRKIDYYKNFLITNSIHLEGRYMFIKREDRDEIIGNFLTYHNFNSLM